MNQQYQIGLVVFDWAGTTVDYGSSAPSEVFGRVFSAAGISLTREEINAPMGMEKKAHIRQLLSCESGRKQWKDRYGRPWNEEDVEKLYQEFEATLSQVVAEYSVPLPGVREAVAALRDMGIKIGSTRRPRPWAMRPTVLSPRMSLGKAGLPPLCFTSVCARWRSIRPAGW